MIKRILLIHMGLILLVLRPVRADSDGYFCIGRDYLAFQFGLAAPPVATHRLSVIRFSDKSGITEPTEIPLPQFQVHGMRCRDRAIDVAAFDSIHTISFDEVGRFIGRSATALPRRGQLPDWAIPQRNLARLSGESCATIITTRVVELDARSRELAQRLIFQGAGSRECGHDLPASLGHKVEVGPPAVTAAR